MFNLFRKKPINLVKHQFKNLLIFLPSNWKYSMEEGDQEACFDPKSQSTLRINIIRSIALQTANAEESIAFLTDDQPSSTTSKGYFLTNPVSNDYTENDTNITLITWRLVKVSDEEKILAILTYTVLSEEKESEKEKEVLGLIEISLNDAELF